MEGRGGAWAWAWEWEPDWGFVRAVMTGIGVGGLRSGNGIV